MIRYLSLLEVLSLHCQIINQSGGASGVRDLGALESAVNTARLRFFTRIDPPKSPLKRGTL